MKIHRCIFLLTLSLFPPALSYCQYDIGRMMDSGKRCMEIHDYSGAIFHFSTVISARPTRQDAFYYRGLSSYYLSDYSNATFDLSKTLSLNPYYYSAYGLLGLCHIHEGLYREAAPCFEHAASYYGDDIDVWYDWAYCLLLSQDYVKADSVASMMTHRWPTHSEGWQLQSIALLCMQNQRQSLQKIEKALSLSPYDSGLLSMKGNLLRERKEWLGAILSYSKSLDINPKDADNLSSRAFCYLMTGNTASAIRDLNMALDISPHHKVALYNRGTVLKQLGKRQEGSSDIVAYNRYYGKDSNELRFIPPTSSSPAYATDAIDNIFAWSYFIGHYKHLEQYYGEDLLKFPRPSSDEHPTDIIPMIEEAPSSDTISVETDE